MMSAELKLSGAEKRHEICNGVDDLTFKQRERLFKATVMQVGLKSFRTVPVGAAIDMDKLTDTDIDAIYAVYIHMVRQNERESEAMLLKPTQKKTH